jgi:hypothetical protein
MKIIITEQQNEKLNKKIRLAVEKLGILQTINMFGGYEMFIKFLPDYFNKNNQIQLINELVEKHKDVEDGPIYLYDLIGRDYTLESSVDDEGNEVVTYLVSVDTDSAGYYVYMYDGDSGEMYDTPIDSGHLKLRYFEDSVLNDIFEMLVNEFLLIG